MSEGAQVTVTIDDSDLSSRLRGNNTAWKRILKIWAQQARTFLLRRFDRLSKSGGGGEWPPLSDRYLEMLVERMGDKNRSQMSKRSKSFSEARAEFARNNAGRYKTPARYEAALRRFESHWLAGQKKQGEVYARKMTENHDKVYGEGKYKGLGKKILVDTGIMRMALDIRGGQAGAVEDYHVGIERYSVEVGIGGVDKHPGSHMTIGELALKHHYGAGLPARPIIVEPDANTINKMIQIAEQELT